jgi:hypothetical protein
MRRCGAPLIFFAIVPEWRRAWNLATARVNFRIADRLGVIASLPTLQTHFLVPRHFAKLLTLTFYRKHCMVT